MESVYYDPNSPGISKNIEKLEILFSLGRFNKMALCLSYFLVGDHPNRLCFG
jgi:hypothetical protein